jgi:lipopolysaccharide/colanic/teichoic acid biosynthesis glycosyltransferase
MEEHLGRLPWICVHLARRRPDAHDSIRDVETQAGTASVPYPYAKRLADKGISIALLMLLAPVFAGAYVAIGIGGVVSPRDRGPWLFRQRRVSRGREFDLLKFRTLRCGVLEPASGTAPEARLLERNPENLTWAGRRLLKPWYLDELPQLFNVLRGDMSLVGPRPWPPSMVREQVAAGYDYREHAMAGWTGPVQVQKGLVEEEGYAALDLEYVEACRSLPGSRLVRLDLAILVRTVRSFLRGEGLTY